MELPYILIEVETSENIIHLKKVYLSKIIPYGQVFTIKFTYNKFLKRTTMLLTNNRDEKVCIEIIDSKISLGEIGNIFQLKLTLDGIQLINNINKHKFTIIESSSLFADLTTYVKYFGHGRIKDNMGFLTLDKNLNKPSYVLPYMYTGSTTYEIFEPEVYLIKGSLNIVFYYRGVQITVGSIYNFNEKSSMFILNTDSVQAMDYDTLSINHTTNYMITEGNFSIMIKKIGKSLFNIHLVVQGSEGPNHYKIAFRLKDDE